MADIPHFRYPFTRTGKNVEVVEQNTEQHFVTNAFNVLLCPTGWRTERPEYGWDPPMFLGVPVDVDSVKQALDAFGNPMSNTTAENMTVGGVDIVQAITAYIFYDTRRI